MEGYPHIIHHGGKQGVTGSCHELRVGPEAGILIDCGLFQGDEGRGTRDENEPFRVPHPASRVPDSIDFPVDHLRALVLTHVHIDHCGRIPWLLAAGFRGPILCSQPSALLLPLMLEDAFRVGVSRDARQRETFLAELKKRLRPLPYGQWQTIPAGAAAELKIRLQPAGHILGSAYVECRVRDAGRGMRDEEEPVRVPRPSSRVPEKHFIFSGDLGAPHAPLLPAPKSPYRADVLVLESTYGDRLHEGRKDRRQRLQAIIEHALANRGAVLIPAFALGRTQELLYELEAIIHPSFATAIEGSGSPPSKIATVWSAAISGSRTRSMCPAFDSTGSAMISARFAFQGATNDAKRGNEPVPNTIRPTV
jgi:metallo-beta-lactamase family protein